MKQLLNRGPVTACVLALAVLSASCSSRDGDRVVLAPDLDPAGELQASIDALALVGAVHHKDVCGPEMRGARCQAKVITDEAGNLVVTHAPPTSGLFPADLRAAYKLPASGGNGRTVAIVDGFDSPNAEADMNTYRAQFGIPPCTTANGCFKKVNGDGQPGPFPPPDPSWTVETAVDLDMVSATCPDCKILLVMAKTGFAVDLGPAVLTAGRLGAFAISNSYAQPEDEPASMMIEPDYNQPGVLILAGAGDNGFDRSTSDDGTVKNQLSNPANVGTVLSVGGTTLTQANTARGWTEAAWRGSGGGCSSHVPKPRWQSDPGCPRRMASDIAAVGDPATGVAYYNGGWSVVGGTSISTPIVAGILTLLDINDPAWLYAHPTSFFDVTSGTTGSCGGTYQCVAGVGYDGPTGVGTPNGAVIAMMGAADAGSGNDGGTGAGGREAGGGGTTVGGGGSSAGTGQGGSTGVGGTGGGGAGATGAGGAIEPPDAGSTGGTSSTGSGSGGNGSAGSGTAGGGSTGSAGSAGSTTTGSSSAATTGAGSPSGAGGSGNPPPPADHGGGCSCRVGTTSVPSDAAKWLLVGVALAIGRRRRVNEVGGPTIGLPRAGISVRPRARTTGKIAALS